MIDGLQFVQMYPVQLFLVQDRLNFPTDLHIVAKNCPLLEDSEFGCGGIQSFIALRSLLLHPSRRKPLSDKCAAGGNFPYLASSARN